MSKYVSCLSFLYHSDGRPAVVVFLPLNDVHERAHKKNAASRCTQDMSRVSRVRNLVDIKSQPKIADRHLKPLGRVAELDVDLFCLVKLVPVLDGVCYRLANGEIDRRNEIVRIAPVASDL